MSEYLAVPTYSLIHGEGLGDDKLALVESLATGARFVLVGLQKNEIVISPPEFHKREATLMSSRNATSQDFEHVVASMKKGLVVPTNYITHRANFDEVKDNFHSWLDPKNGVVKAMVTI